MRDEREDRLHLVRLLERAVLDTPPCARASAYAAASRFCQLGRAGRFAAVTDGSDVLGHGIAAVAGARRERRRVE